MNESQARAAELALSITGILFSIGAKAVDLARDASNGDAAALKALEEMEAASASALGDHERLRKAAGAAAAARIAELRAREQPLPSAAALRPEPPQPVPLAEPVDAGE